MRLRGLNIHDFRSISELELDFIDHATGEPLPFVALVGPNGCGKTSILEALGWLIATVCGKASEPPLGVRGAFIGSNDGQSQLRASKGELVVEPPPGIPRPPSGEVARPLREHWIHAGAGNSLFIPAGRDPWVQLNRPIEPGRGVTPDAKLALDPRSSATQARMDHIHQWLLHQRLLGDRDTAALWDLVHVFLAPIRYVGVSEANHDLLFDVDGAGTRVGFNQLSSGQRKLILLLAEVIHHGQGRGVLLLDEPEAHFHPLWQRELRRVLTSLLSDGQVIVATHSPYVLDSLPPTELFLLGEIDMERP